MMLALFTDDMRTVERMCLGLLADLPDDDPYLRGSVELCFIYSQREFYRLDSLHRIEATVRSFFERAHSQFVLVWHESIIGPSLIQRGELDAAASGYRSAIGIADRIGGHYSPLAAMPAMMLAELKMDRGDYSEAKALWDEYLPVCEELGLLDYRRATQKCHRFGSNCVNRPKLRR
jgi:LuxR family maltose regulon positive regulatory protein